MTVNRENAISSRSAGEYPAGLDGYRCGFGSGHAGVILHGLLALCVTVLLGLPGTGWAASQNGMPAHQMGPDSGRGSGGFLSTPVANGGLDTHTAYFIEVPPGAPNLVVDVFDADVNNPGGGNTLDWPRDGTFGNEIRYELFNPGGGSVAIQTCNNASAGPFCVDGSWQNLFSTANPTAGHWELQIEMVDIAGTGDDDTSGHAIRAHAGNPAAGDLELNVYAESYFHPGYSFRGGLGGSSAVHDYYPFVSGGCDYSVSDFDSDTNTSTVSVNLETTTNTTLPTFTDTIDDGVMSDTNVWASNTITGFTAPQIAEGYGIWDGQFNIDQINIPPDRDLNWTTTYVGSYTSPATTVNNVNVINPSAQPETGSFRVYLPTDPASNPDNNATRGGVPVKPFMNQRVLYIAGPNPPEVTLPTSTTSMAIQITLENPTPHPVGGRPGDVVEAFVPGGAVVYAGNASTTQGTVTGQPAVGASGTVTWQPGVLAAGGRAFLLYHIDVTPTGPGPLDVTGGPGANGTTWTYLDETGNTTQPRATYEFGELCQLSVDTVVTLTYTNVAAVSGLLVDGLPTVAWETATEVGTVGFVLERQSADGFQPVASIRAPGDSPGARYRLADPDVAPGSSQRYRLRERQVNGMDRLHGPFSVRFDTTAAPAPAREALSLPVEQQDRLARAGRTATPTPPAPTSHLKLGLRETGLYRLEATTIAANTQHDEATVRAALASGAILLSENGQPVAWRLTDDGAGLWFFGQAPEGQYHAERIYWLTVGEPGPVMDEIPATPDGRGPASRSFAERLRFGEDQRAMLSLPAGPDDNYWYWGTLAAGDPTVGSQQYTLTVADPLDDDAELGLSLRGFTDAPGIAPDHRVAVKLNGTELGDFGWNGNAPREARFRVPAGLLQAGANTLTLTALATNGDSVFLLDEVTLHHRRLARLTDGELLLGPMDAPLELIFSSGFGDPRQTPDILLAGVTGPARVLGLEDAQAPVWLSGASQDADNLRFAPQAGRHWVGTRERRPDWVQPADPALATRTGGADYLVITTAALQPAAERLADHRRQQGLAARVVSMDAITDGHGHGYRDPRAIRAFLADAAARWSPAPRYVVLAGNGSFDYRNLQGHNDNLLPPLMVGTTEGLFASDAALVDFDGDGFADLPIGRIPALDNAELDAYVDKLIRYEAGAGDWSSRLLLLADDQEPGMDFAADSRQVASVLPPGLAVETLDLDTTPLGGARDRLFQALADGVGWINYLGHGSSDRLAREQLLATSDVAGLENPVTPVITALTCLSNFFEMPGFATLGEALVLNPDGGAVSVIAPTGLAQHPEAVILSEALFQVVFVEGERVLGEALLRALQDNAGDLGETGPLYILFGDPALQLR